MCYAQILSLTDNQIGDAGVTALADVCARGAMASLKQIYFIDTKHMRHPGLVAACQPRGIKILYM